MLIEGGLSEEESLAVASALHKLGVEEPSGLADVDEKYARQAADAAGLKPIRADKLVKIIASMSLPSPTAKAEEASAVAAHLIKDFKMNAKVNSLNKITRSFFFIPFPFHVFLSLRWRLNLLSTLLRSSTSSK